MTRRNHLAWLALSMVLIMACGPETIFLRPALDTPEQHVKNGQTLLKRGKIDAASAEFARARSLDDGYAPAYIGLALVQGHRGDINGGFETLQKARRIAATPDEAKAVDRGFETLEGMRLTIQN